MSYHFDFYSILPFPFIFFFFFNDTATTEIYTLSLHDALPIWSPDSYAKWDGHSGRFNLSLIKENLIQKAQDRKSTRLNSSHSSISYAVFCLKKKKKKKIKQTNKTTKTTQNT